jgi:predicted small metal-binding protein
MAKILKCGDFIYGCKFEARGTREWEALKIFALHVKAAHNMSEISPELLSKIRRAIREEGKSLGHAASSH